MLLLAVSIFQHSSFFLFPLYFTNCTIDTPISSIVLLLHYRLVSALNSTPISRHIIFIDLFTPINFSIHLIQPQLYLAFILPILALYSLHYAYCIDLLLQFGLLLTAFCHAIDWIGILGIGFVIVSDYVD